MPGILVRIFVCLIGCAIASQRASAQVIPVPLGDSSAPPTLTFYWEGIDSRALLVLIPGGQGRINLDLAQKDVQNDFYQTLKQLSLGSNPKEKFDVVLFSSPELLGNNPKGYPSDRATNDHMSRIHSVIKFYKEKTQKPVWLMGHSNGSISVTEYQRYEAKLGQPSQIFGIIISGARNVAFFDSNPLNLPILFLHHQKDGCAITDPGVSLAKSKKVQDANKAPTTFIYIETGNAEAKNPCESGYHMYKDARPEVVTALRNFMVPLNP